VIHVQYVDVDGIRTRYLEAGSGQPVVLIHGGQFGSYYNAAYWELNLRGLADEFRVIAVDKLGQGYTDNPRADDAYTMTNVIEHCQSFVVALGLENVTVVGHSRGALPAARIALDRPVSVARLVLVDTNTLAPDHPSTPTDFYSSIEAILPATPTGESVRIEPRLNSYSTEHVTPEFLEQVLAVARLEKVGQARDAIDRVRDAFLGDLRRQRDATLDAIRGGELRVPALVMWGANDRSAPLALGYDLFHHLALGSADVELHVLNRAAHYVFREQAARFNAVLAEFVRT
jgi:pimeloyl-ACP methyl ester carboxylesterase